jgi:hypothetical protein
VGFARGATEDEADGLQNNNGYEPSISDTVSQPDFESTSSVGDEEVTNSPSVPINQHVGLSRDVAVNVVGSQSAESIKSHDSYLRNGHKPEIEKIAVTTDLQPSAVKQSTSSLQSEILQQVKGVTSDDVPQLNGQRSMKAWEVEKLDADPYAEVLESSMPTARSDLASSLMFDGMSLSSRKEESSVSNAEESIKMQRATIKESEEDAPLRVDSRVSGISAARTSQLPPPSATSPIPSEMSKETNAAKLASQLEPMKAGSVYSEPKPIPAAANTVKPVNALETKLSTDMVVDSKLQKSGGRLIAEVGRFYCSAQSAC